MKDYSTHNIHIRPYTRLMNWYRRNNFFIPGLNTVARLVLQFRFVNEQKQVEQFYKKNKAEYEQWITNTILFFGFGSFRSGTVFLSNLLRNEIIKSHIEHEANVLDYYNYTKALNDKRDALTYVKQFRLKEIYWRTKGKKVNIYGEVNPFLRLHAKAIKQVLPQAKLFHIVRDGREVVRSIYSREILGKSDPLNRLIKPPTTDPYFTKWSSMSRFEKICWQWQYDNRFIREAVGHTIQFEQLRSDFSYFKTYLTDYLGIDISESVWGSYVAQKQNITPTYRLPHYKDWTNEQLSTFKEICGDEMRACGYEL